MAVAGGPLVLLVRTVAECAAVGELPVHAGDVDAVVVFQQLRRGRVREGAAAPRAVLVRLGPLRLETGVLREDVWEEDKKNGGTLAGALINHLTVPKEKVAFVLKYCFSI